MGKWCAVALPFGTLLQETQTYFQGALSVSPTLILDFSPLLSLNSYLTENCPTLPCLRTVSVIHLPRLRITCIEHSSIYSYNQITFTTFNL